LNVEGGMAMGRRAATVTGAVSVMTVLSLASLGWNWLAGSTVTATGPGADMDGITVDVRASEWAPLSPADPTVLDQSGFAMPSQMLPGAPGDGEVRLGVRVTLSNTTSAPEEFSLVEDFTMTGGLEPEPAPLSADTVGEVGRLGPGSALNAVLYFDLAAPEDEDMPPLYLKWTRGRDAVLIPVPLPGGEAPEPHQH
jgi:hypothetical protein